VLSRREPRWFVVPNDWVFRGQANSTWPLTPSAFRPGNFRSRGTALQPKGTHKEQAEEEARLIQQFVRGLDQQGLPLPVEAAARWLDRRSMLEDFHGSEMWRNWPPPELAPLVALAQHYQVPTRLLDWTENPLVAAYFAALEAAEHVEERRAESFAVWAAHNSVSMGFAFQESHEFSRFNVELVRAPRSSNPNLRAQAGIFTRLTDREKKPDDPAFIPPLDELVQNLHAESQRSGRNCHAWLWKLEVPVAEAPKLLRYLAYEGVSGTYLYPGLGGVVQGMREKALWDVEMYGP